VTLKLVKSINEKGNFLFQQNEESDVNVWQFPFKSSLTKFIKKSYFLMPIKRGFSKCQNFRRGGNDEKKF
jgi:hypothetical protein